MSAPHDRLSFDELQNKYNFRTTSDWQTLFVRLLWHALNAKRRIIRNPRALLALYCRMRRAPHTEVR